MYKAWFKAYDARGELAGVTWTSSRVTEDVERSAYQARLDRGELSAVDVAYEDPHRRNETLLPQRREPVMRYSGEMT